MNWPKEQWDRCIRKISCKPSSLLQSMYCFCKNSIDFDCDNHNWMNRKFNCLIQLTCRRNSTISSHFVFFFFWYFKIYLECFKLFSIFLHKYNYKKKTSRIQIASYTSITVTIGSFDVYWSAYTIESVNQNNKRKKKKQNGWCIWPLKR